jgi:integrase
MYLFYFAKMNSDCEENRDIPENILQRAAEVSADLLPVKSRLRYEQEYNSFTEWRTQKRIKIVSDDILLVYFSEKANTMKSSTLWSRFSMLKSCLAIKENTHHQYPKTIAFLKRQAVGYIPKKSKILTAEQVTKFLCEASDGEYLLAKVILVFGIFGACRRDDLIRLSLDDVEDNGRFLVVFLRDGKTHRSRSFTITNENCKFDPCTIYRKYADLRPKHMESRRLFVAYRNQRCYAQHVGCHTISGIPKLVAKYLKLKNPEEYTGHGLRRSSATMLVESGGDLLTLKRHGGWLSSNVAEG